MTLSSFTTLSLTPPLITFNIRAPSRTLSAIKQSRCFLIHVLGASKEGSMIADSFTRGNSEKEEVNKLFHPETRWFTVENVVAGGEGELYLPKLVGKGVKRVLACALSSSSEPGVVKDGLVTVGDHVMVIAKVTAIFPGQHAGDARIREDYGLTYVDGSYRKVGKAIGTHDTKNDIDMEG
jgi:flavin reductase (DIM6/NTAB) family NADH-FMN oxidoreductase RutF